MDKGKLIALPVLFLAVCGVISGLARMGVDWAAAVAARWAEWHGVLLAAGLMGVVISLERAVAYKRHSGFAAPVLALAGAGVLLAGLDPLYAQGLLALAALSLAWVSFRLWRLQPSLHGALLVLAALFWLSGTLVWLETRDPAAGVMGWLLFLVLTIAAERLELSRYQPLSAGARRLFSCIIGTLAMACFLACFDAHQANLLFGWSLAALALWLLRHDVARRTWWTPGATRYIASCLLSGYVWLLFAGALGATGSFDPGQPWRDAALHAITLGFVFSMIYGHALIILPAVARVRVNFHPVLYLLLLGLHLTLALRVYAGLSGHWDWRAPAGQANALALLAFILTLALLTRRMRARRS